MADYMREQEKKIGISADWSREKFTLDPKISDVVLETFIKMYNDGLIYKGKRIISWCPRCGSALSDLEVKYTEREGKLYYIKYPLENQIHYHCCHTRPKPCDSAWQLIRRSKV
jgi:valyl-tRNA synthetase